VNNIHEKDWAEDDGWSCHSGMASNPYEEDDPLPRQDVRADGDGQAADKD
jgi:hypothetical protein